MVRGITDTMRVADLFRPTIEVVAGNVSRAEITDHYPRTVDADRLPLSRRVEVETPAGVLFAVCVRFMRIGGFIYASASPMDRVRGEDFHKSGEFPVASELVAEALGLESL